MMSKHLSVLARFYLFWVLVSFMERLVFLIYFLEKLNFQNWHEYLSPFYHGLRLDLSMAGYFSLLPLLVYLINWNFPSIKISQKLPKIYVGFWLMICGIISVVNFNLYREWGAKLNFRAIEFGFKSPNEALASSASSPFFLSLAILGLFLIAGFYLAKKLVRFQIPSTGESVAKKISLSFGLLLATFILIRGGWQLSPINQSMSYYSDKPIENHAAVNTFWNLFRDILNNRGGRTNPYIYLPETQANQLLDSLYVEPEIPSPEILNKPKPNVVFIILESFTADVVESLGGEKNVSPQLEKLIEKGILFENTFASGDRTDKGLIAILSGFPSQATQSIIKENGKQEKLPAISKVFKNAGYSTSFYYGGESEFAGMKSYIMSHGYDKLIDKHEFAAVDMNSKWGAFDGKVFQKELDDLNTQKQPFFSTLLSLTNHEPFELPVKPKFPGEDLKNRFKSTAFYTDSCLGAFLQSAEKQAWYKNTLFVVVADHGHRLPKDEFENWHPSRYRVPLIFFGDVLKPEFRGKKISKFGGQTDIAKTVLDQLKMDSSPFKWSKDLLNPQSADFAFFDWDNGFGWATPSQILTFDNVSKQVIYRKHKTEQDTELENRGKAYLQKVYQTYLDY